jgi:hypothetical protein
MPGFLKQSTAAQSRAIGPFVDDTDFKTPKTGLTIANTDIKLVINGAASANKNSGGGTHRVNGVYGVTFDATDTATVGEIDVSVVVAGALPFFDKFFVVEEAVYDAFFAGSSTGVPLLAALEATAQSILTDTAEIGAAGAGLTNINLPDQTMSITGNITGNLSGSVGSVTGAVGSVTGNVGGNVTGSVGSVAAGGITATSLAADAITAAKIADGAIDAATFAAGAINAAAIAADAITAAKVADGTIDAATFAAGAINAAAISADAGAELADAFLDRDMSTGTDSGSTTVRTVRQALRFLRNKWAIATGTLTVYKEDDSTSSWTAAVTGDSAADPIVSSDPGGP